MRILPSKKLDILSEVTSHSYSDFTNELLEATKGKVTTDYSLAIASKNGEFIVPHSVNGQKLDWKLYQKIYNNVGIVKNAINNTANFAIQSGYELTGANVEKVDKWIDEHNFDLDMLNILKQMLVYGNAYLEISGEDYKHLPVEQMFVVVKKGGDDGKLLGYVQKNGSQEIRFGPDEIIHFKWNELGTSFYGMPDIRASLDSVKHLLQYLEDIGEIIHRYGHPIIHWVVGTEDSPGSSGQLHNLKTNLDSRKVGEDLITSFGVEGKVLSSDMKLIQLDGLLHVVENQLIGALEIPSFFIRGGESSNKSTSQSELQAFDRKVKALRSAMGQTIEEKIFKSRLNSDTKFAWKELSTQGEVDKSTIMKNLVLSGVPTKVALEMVGWGNYAEMFEKPEFPAKPGFGQEPGGPPKEDDFETQAEYVEALERYKKGLMH